MATSQKNPPGKEPLLRGVRPEMEPLRHHTKRGRLDGQTGWAPGEIRGDIEHAGEILNIKKRWKLHAKKISNWGR